VAQGDVLVVACRDPRADSKSLAGVLAGAVSMG
jgi:hypothetical protein